MADTALGHSHEQWSAVLGLCLSMETSIQGSVGTPRAEDRRRILEGLVRILFQIHFLHSDMKVSSVVLIHDYYSALSQYGLHKRD